MSEPVVVAVAVAAVTVEAEPIGRGVWFAGPERRVAWSPVGVLSSALSYAVEWTVAMHPWDAWPNPNEPSRDVYVPPPARVLPVKRKQSRRTRRGRAYV